MPRRAPKHAFKSGEPSANPNGRPVGAGNKVVISEKVREAFAQLLENNIGELEGWLHSLAKKNPEKALDIWVRISERFVPSLQRTDVHLEGPGLMIPIQINLPNPPQINLGEATATPLLESPAEEIKELREGSLAEDQGDSLDSESIRERAPAFVFPKPILSANQLRDLKEMGMEPPGEAGLADKG
jgi:hypothetical protein